MYRHILVPTDGSVESIHAAEEAKQLAEQHGARLTLLTVRRTVDSGQPDALGIDGAERALRESEQKKGEARLAETVEALASTSVDVETEQVPGKPYRAICDYVESANVDLVVLGTIGKDSLSSYLLGSTTERVTQLCDVPVLVV